MAAPILLPTHCSLSFQTTGSLNGRLASNAQERCAILDSIFLDTISCVCVMAVKRQKASSKTAALFCFLGWAKLHTVIVCHCSPPFDLIMSRTLVNICHSSPREPEWIEIHPMQWSGWRPLLLGRQQVEGSGAFCMVCMVACKRETVCGRWSSWRPVCTSRKPLVKWAEFGTHHAIANCLTSHSLPLCLTAPLLSLVPCEAAPTSR